MNKEIKTIITIIIATLAILATIIGATATAPEVNQITPNPSTFGVDFIRMTASGYALLKNTNHEYYKWNGTNWYEIASPNLFTTTNIIAEKTHDKIYVLAHNNTNYQIWEYNPTINITGGWTLIKNTTTPTDYNTLVDFACSPYATTFSSPACLIAVKNTTLGQIVDANTGSILYNTTGVPAKLFYQKSVFVATTNATLYRRGISTWTGLIAQSPQRIWEEDTLHFGFTISIGTFYIFNQTTSSMQSIADLGGFVGRDMMMVNEDDMQFFFADSMDLSSNGNVAYIGSYNVPYNNQTYYNSTINPICSKSSNRRSYDYQQSADFFNGFIGCNAGGRIIQVGQSQEQTGITTIGITGYTSPNPTIYGETANFYANPTHVNGGTADINVQISNSTGSVLYEWDWLGVQSGTQATNNIGGIAWTNFEPNTNYTTTLTATFSYDAQVITHSYQWTTISSTSINTTNYTNTAYNASCFSELVSIDNQGANRVFAVAKNNTQAILCSFDITNPNSIIVKTKEITGAETPTAISLGNNRAFIGTTEKLFVLNNTQLGDANQTTQNEPPIDYSAGSDYVYDVGAIDDDYAWTCGQNNNLFISDKAELFNFTLYDFQDSLGSTNPCLTSHYQDGYLFIHKGTSGIQIYNATNQTLLSTITGISSQASGATHDRISKYGDFLFVITGTTQITKYNITNPTSPVEVYDCNTNYDAQSIEALSENEVIVGSTSALRVCDFAESSQYDASSAKFLSTNLKTYTGAENPTEITMLNDDGKYAVAEGNKIGIYFFQKTTEQTTTNNPPTITSISLSKNTLCLNEQTSATILATDAENDPLTYDYDCTGTKAFMTNNYITNEFTCSYTSMGTKTIKSWARDASPTPVLSSTSVTVNNCTASPQIELKVLDGNTGENVADATAVLTGTNGSTKTTSSSGVVLWQYLNSTEAYSISISKSGYFTLTKTVYPQSVQQIAYLEPTTDTSGNPVTTLGVYVKDKNTLALIENALVSVQDPNTGKSLYAFTDATGLALLTSMFPTTKGIVTASLGTVYEQTSEYFTLASGEQKTLIILLSNATETHLTSRGCEDQVSGLILCSPLNITGDGDKCQTDNDCLGGECDPSGWGLSGTCSNFNWSQCDEAGRARNTQCVASLLAQRGAENTADTALKNFLYVLVFLAIFVLVIMWKNSQK